jgi:branched-chain amino acid transport system ATP-binding protein
MALLELVDIKVNYGKVRALKGISLSIERGQFVGLIGPNGAGKSTLLDSISGLTADWSGRITYDGIDLSRVSPAGRVQLGLVHCPERRHLFPFMSVRDNLMLGSYSKAARESNTKNLDLVFALFPVLKEKQHDPANTLSGGQSQMVAIGRALLANPKVLMLDEPMLGVAPVLRSEFSAALEKLKGMKITVVITEQELFLTISRTDIIYIINDGLITDCGTPEEYLKGKDLKSLYFCK